MNFYYDVFGGSLRNLRYVHGMTENVMYPEDIYDVAQAEMKSFFGGYELAGVPEATWEKTAKALARKLQYPTEGMASSHQVNPDIISRSVIIHWTPSALTPGGWRDMPATRFMRHLAGRICDTSKQDALSRLRGAIGHSGICYLHEHDAHQFRLRHLGKEHGITLWSLRGKRKKALCLPIKRVVRIRNVSDIEHLEEGDYGLPTVSNFPFLDAVMKPHYLFQDTVSQDRHTSVAKIPEILEVLKIEATDTAQIDLIYTLGTDNFDNFKMNDNELMRPFSQWKTRMEAHTDDTAMKRKRYTGKAVSTGKKGRA